MEAPFVFDDTCKSLLRDRNRIDQWYSGHLRICRSCESVTSTCTRTVGKAVCSECRKRKVKCSYEDDYLFSCLRLTFKDDRPQFDMARSSIRIRRPRKFKTESNCDSRTLFSTHDANTDLAAARASVVAASVVDRLPYAASSMHTSQRQSVDLPVVHTYVFPAPAGIPSTPFSASLSDHAHFDRDFPPLSNAVQSSMALDAFTTRAYAHEAASLDTDVLACSDAPIDRSSGYIPSFSSMPPVTSGAYDDSSISSGDCVANDNTIAISGSFGPSAASHGMDAIDRLDVSVQTDGCIPSTKHVDVSVQTEDPIHVILAHSTYLPDWEALDMATIMRLLQTQNDALRELQGSVT
ncbi:hypothetical protein C8J57DRAFT_293032 [Mycena rebaudengoi]|nr:hypothetical protein C8J57DRAFT_293032 [Mycena rebaudengoi]